MGATLSVKEVNGATPGTPNTITTMIMCTKDVYNPGTSYPIPIIAGQTTRSYWKSIYLNADTTPDGTINNIKFYCDGDLTGWTGITCYVGTTDTYTQVTGTEGETGDDSTVATNNITSYTASSPLSVSGSITNPNTGKISDYVVIQVDVDGDSAEITSHEETFTWRYDET